MTVGNPPVIIHFNGIFHYKPQILGIPHDYGKSHLSPTRRGPPLFAAAQVEHRFDGEDLALLESRCAGFWHMAHGIL